MGIKRLVLLVCLIFNFFIQSVQGGEDELLQLKEEFKIMRQKMDVMQKRIEQLETERTQAKTEQEQAKEEFAQVKETVERYDLSLKERVSWHGYFDWTFSDETRNGANPTFDAFALALIPKFTLTDRIDIFSQIVFEHALFYDISVSGSGARSLDSRSSGELTLNDAYLTYTFNENFKFRAGKFATPFGIWNTLMYATPTYVTVKQPGRDTLYSRGSSTAADSNLFARYGMGAWFLGNYDIFSYDLYLVNGRTLLNQHKDDTRDKGIGTRLGVEFEPGPTKLKLSHSFYQDQLRTASSEPFFKQWTHLLSSEFSWSNFMLISELADSEKGGVSMNAFYTLLQYNLGKRFIPFMQYQYWEPNRKASDDKIYYYTGGLAFQILPWETMLKIQVDRVNNQNSVSEDYNRYLLGLAAAF